MNETKLPFNDCLNWLWLQKVHIITNSFLSKQDFRFKLWPDTVLDSSIRRALFTNTFNCIILLYGWERCEYGQYYRYISTLISTTYHSNCKPIVFTAESFQKCSMGDDVFLKNISVCEFLILVHMCGTASIRTRFNGSYIDFECKNLLADYGKETFHKMCFTVFSLGKLVSWFKAIIALTKNISTDRKKVFLNKFFYIYKCKFIFVCVIAKLLHMNCARFVS